MSVRSVKRAGGDRLVAVLERQSQDCEPAGRLLVTITRAEAHVLYHELRAERTLPGQSYELMADIVSELKGKLTAIELIAGEAGKPTARLRLERSNGRSTVPARAGQALALAVHLKVPLLVAEALLTGSAAQTDPAGEDAEPATALAPSDAPGESAVEVPEVFLRAFDE
jgi:bifunctional DNase/RNase